MGLVAFRDAPTETVGEQFFGKALAEMGVTRNRLRKPVQPVEGRTRGVSFRSRERHRNVDRRPILVGGAVQSDGVVLLERQTICVEECMTGGAARVLAMLFEGLANVELR